MKIALFCNYMDNIGGAEYVNLFLAKKLNADIYTTNINEEKIKQFGFNTDNIYSIGKVPKSAPFRQEATYFLFKFLKLKKKYDFYLFFGDWTLPAAKKYYPNLWYIYSPTREIYDQSENIKNSLKSKYWPKHLLQLFFIVFVKVNQFLNRLDVKNINTFVSISRNIQNRMKKYLNIDSSVIYAPTETKKFFSRKSDYWLTVGRIVPAKRIDLQIKAFSQLPTEKLKIVGDCDQSKTSLEYFEYCKKIKPKNVEFIHSADSKEILEIYADCKGFIATAIDEDYGMGPVEAMASGKPVVASNEGGYKETIINKKTGILIDDINEDKIAEAIKALSKDLHQNSEQIKKDCQNQAQNFDADLFVEKIKNLIGVKA